MAPFLVALLLSFLPAAFYVFLVDRVDRFEKEPRWLLTFAFCWGAVVAVVGAIVAEVVLQTGTSIFLAADVTDALSTAVYAPLVEEAVKGFAVLLVLLVARHEFDTLLDGIVYASVTALGFAATENLLYIMGGYSEEGWPGLFSLFFLRVILGAWNHAVYTSFTGIGLAVARLSRSWVVKLLAPPLGFALAVLAHGLHNGTLVLFMWMGFDAGLVVTLLTDWLGWVFITLIMLWGLWTERRWIRAYLADEVGVLLSPEQYATACSLRKQFVVRWGTIGTGQGPQTRHFYQLCAELAQKKHQAVFSGDGVAYHARIESLREELARLAPSAHAAS